MQHDRVVELSLTEYMSSKTERAPEHLHKAGLHLQISKHSIFHVTICIGHPLVLQYDMHDETLTCMSSMEAIGDVTRRLKCVNNVSMNS